MNIEVLIDKKYPIETKKYGSVTVHLSGDVRNAGEIVGCLVRKKKPDNELFSLVKKNKGNFSIIIASESYVFAAVDRVRSYPLYYSHSTSRHFVSNSSSKILSQLSNPKVNQDSLITLAMSGYVFGKETLYSDIKQMQAGEALFWRNDDSNPEITRYYTYLPEPIDTKNSSALLDEFSDVVDIAISQLIKLADGRPIWVPLSGGLDSRLIVAKLVEHKYNNISTFSYGNNGNHEMRQAQYVANQLQVPWYKIPSKSKRAYDLYQSSLRKEYEQYSHGLTNIPSYMEFEPLVHLKDKGSIPDDAIIVNGQTGDFVTGGHVPEFLLQNDVKLEDIFDYIINKHCSFWKNIHTKKNIEKILDILSVQFKDIQNISTKVLSLPSLYECWEWQERQSKLVVRGQRLYDFLGLQWNLPFWHADMMEFWRKVPYALKLNQSLYVNYLRKYNYKNVFTVLRQKVQPWTLRYSWIPCVAKIIKVFSGNLSKERFYKKMHFYSTYHPQYALFGHEYYLKHYRECRDPASFMVSHFLKEMGLEADFDSLA